MLDPASSLISIIMKGTKRHQKHELPWAKDYDNHDTMSHPLQQTSSIRYSYDLDLVFNKWAGKR